MNAKKSKVGNLGDFRKLTDEEITSIVGGSSSSSVSGYVSVGGGVGSSSSSMAASSSSYEATEIIIGYFDSEDTVVG